MRCSVTLTQPCAVDAENDRQALEGNVMYDLVVAALQEGRVDGGYRMESVRRKPRREGQRMLLRDADVKEPVGARRTECLQSRPLAHRGGDSADAIVTYRFLSGF